MRMMKPRRVRKRNLIAILTLFTAVRGWCADVSNVDDPLLDLFIKKGYVTQKEAEQVKAEADFNRTNGVANYASGPSKWIISTGIKNMELFGDIRLRYESRSAEDPKGGSIDLDRLRAALRLGLRGEAFDNFYYGVRLDTSANPRSSWVTLGTSSGSVSSGSPYQGPFGKSTAGIGIGQIYLGWHLEDWVDVILGKIPNPFYTTPMVWDNDLSPDGIAERFKYTVGVADFFATFGQFLYQDTNPTFTGEGYFNPLTGNISSLPFMLAWQVGVNYHVTDKVNFKVAPVLYQYDGLQNEGTPITGGVGPDFYGTFVGQGTVFGVNGASAAYNLAGSTPGFDGFYANQTGLNDLLVLEVPFELDAKFTDVNVRLFGDYAYNLDGAARATAAYNAANSPYFSVSGPGGGTIEQIPSPQTHDVVAYQIGLGIGSSDLKLGPTQGLVYGNSSHKHDWEFRTYWQHVEQYALDPNLVDSDFFEGRENMEGIYAALAYAFSDNVFLTVRYGYADRINDKLGTAGSDQDIPQMNPINHYNLLQVDATLRF
jgi:Putative porin